MSEQQLANAVNVKCSQIQGYEAQAGFPSGAIINKLNRSLGIRLPTSLAELNNEMHNIKKPELVAMVTEVARKNQISEGWDEMHPHLKRLFFVSARVTQALEAG